MKLGLMCATLALLCWTGLAMAGGVTVRDQAHVLSSGDVARLSSDAAPWPFDLHVLTAVFPTRDLLEDQAHQWVDSPRAVVVAVDPQNHHVVVRFGTGTGVHGGDFDSLAKAGNAHFRSGDWVDGIEAIGVRAYASTQTASGISVSNEPVVLQQGLGFWIWALIVGAGAGLVWLTWWVMRRSREVLDENRLETAELRSRNIKDADWERQMDESVARRPTPPSIPRSRPAARVCPSSAGGNGGTSSVVVNQQGSSGDGLLTGMLIGEELGRGRDRDVVVEREVVREAPQPSRNDDAGGGSSDFGGGSSSFGSDTSSSSSDSGGSSSSWDSGGSSDFGGGGDSGGGFDSGGGGSDF